VRRCILRFENEAFCTRWSFYRFPRLFIEWVEENHSSSRSVSPQRRPPLFLRNRSK
jgi:hypothetical protein